VSDYVGIGRREENHNITPRQIMKLVDKKYSVKLSCLKAWRAKEKVKEMIFENIEKSYSYVPALKRKLKTRNFGSHIDYLLEDDRAFQRIFVSFRSF